MILIGLLLLLLPLLLLLLLLVVLVVLVVVMLPLETTSEITPITAAAAQSSRRRCEISCMRGQDVGALSWGRGGRGRGDTCLGPLRATVTGVLLVELTAPHCTQFLEGGSLPLIADPIMPSRAAARSSRGTMFFVQIGPQIKI